MSHFCLRSLQASRRDSQLLCALRSPFDNRVYKPLQSAVLYFPHNRISKSACFSAINSRTVNQRHVTVRVPNWLQVASTQWRRTVEHTCTACRSSHPTVLETIRLDPCSGMVLLNTGRQCSTRPRFTAMIAANRFQNCPIGSIHVKHARSTFLCATLYASKLPYSVAVMR